VLGERCALSNDGIALTNDGSDLSDNSSASSNDGRASSKDSSVLSNDSSALNNDGSALSNDGIALNNDGRADLHVLKVTWVYTPGVQRRVSCKSVTHNQCVVTPQVQGAPSSISDFNIL
jgi:hypothetical protein